MIIIKWNNELYKKVINVDENAVIIVVKKRAHDYMAHLKNDKAIWECNKDFDKAIMKLMFTLRLNKIDSIEYMGWGYRHSVGSKTGHTSCSIQYRRVVPLVPITDNLDYVTCPDCIKILKKSKEIKIS